MARNPNKPHENPMDILVGDVAGLMQRRKIKPVDLCHVLGYSDARPLSARMNDPSLFTGSDINHICHFFGGHSRAACT